MSNELIVVKDTDLSELELDKIRSYMEGGLPGIGDINSSQLHRMVDLYMSGSTYSQIAHTLEIKRIIVIYLAHINQWYLAKREGLNEIQEKIISRVLDSKLRNQEFRLLLIQAWQKKIGKQLTKYLSTNDEEHMDGVDLKEVAQLMKAMEWADSLDDSGSKGNGKGNGPAVSINIGAGASIEKTGANKLNITPKEPSIGDMLANIANTQRAEQRLKEGLEKKPDIEDNNNGVKNETE